MKIPTFGPACATEASAAMVPRIKTASFVFMFASARVSAMPVRISMAILCCLLAGCASVKSTAAYYMPVTAKTYPPKSQDTVIPIFGKSPDRRYTVIGRLAFESDQGWNFLRQSMIYNAQANGADAVILRATNQRRQAGLINVPPRMDWMPVSNYYRGCKGRVYGNTTWVPVMQPGYVQPYIQDIMGIDSEMIVYKK